MAWLIWVFTNCPLLHEWSLRQGLTETLRLTWNSVLVRKVSVAVVKHHERSSFGWKGLISPHTSHHSLSVREVRAGAQGGDLESGTEAEAVKECFVSCRLALTRSGWFTCFHVDSTRTVIPGMVLPTVS